MRKTIALITVIMLFTITVGIPIYSSSGSIDNDTIEELIRDSFELYVNLYVDNSNILDKKAAPISEGDFYKYYLGKGNYAKAETIENLISTLYTNEIGKILYKDYRYKKVGDTLYYMELSYRSKYTLPEKLIENIDIVNNADGNAYIIFPYIQYDLSYNEMYIKHMGVYFKNTENGWRISDINYVPKHFDKLPLSSSDEMTETEANILVKNAFNLAYLTRNTSTELLGHKNSDKTIINKYDQTFNVPCKGFEKYEDWLNIASNILTENRVNPVFKLANNRSWLKVEDEVYVFFGGAQYEMLQLPQNNCKLISTGNGKALAEVTLEYHHDPYYENIQILNLTVEFVKTENGWRISGGEYYDYLYIDRSVTNPKTDDSGSLILLAVFALTVSHDKRKFI